MKNDNKRIAEYEKYHLKENSRPAITKSLIDAHVLNMEIFRTGNRLFMIMEVSDEYSNALKKSMDENNPDVQEWERLMENFQQPLPWAKEGEKWVIMDQIYSIK